MSETKSKYTVRAIRASAFENPVDPAVGLGRRTAVSPLSEGGFSEGLWMGRVTSPPGMNSGKHHHGEAESAAFVVSGHYTLDYGDNYEETLELGPGDFIYVGPWVPHIERNLSETEPVEFIAVRRPGNTIFNLEEE